MKSYANLHDTFLSDDTIREAIRQSLKGRRKKRAVKRFLERYPTDEEQIAHMRRVASNFRNAKHTPREIYDGISHKRRTIIVPTFHEIIVHHMVVITLRPMFTRGMYFHTYAAVPGRGPHKGKRYVERWIREDPRNCKYVLKLDIRKYFDSIPHEILLRKLRGSIRDRRFLAVVEEIVNVQPVGIPLGFYTSQWIANWYLQDLDHFVKEKLGAVHFMRYQDDIVIFGSNKLQLHVMRVMISCFARDALGLTVKHNWQVYRFDWYDRRRGLRRGRDLDYMGFRFWRDRTTLRKSILRKLKRKARKIHKTRPVSVFEARQMLSYLGWIKATNTYKAYKKDVKPLVSFRLMRLKVSRFDRKMNLLKEAA